ncbi:group III truncated hemoglobin [Azospirillum sp. RWY-5-1]|uniref:Group III truncated hemoglobin n=1 Tax=Azospirillum oleiclasticum TaxID=2735135 RepID=A0ABX2TAH4_9PROT|nr:group III truncated hemoglobin [Azospirillum oleiclasticum]NYZ13070.1 group III truncated hemoglobin [Azospirillum oleiclasticum]NYZ20257.1 group III truncated hemoglobin [Azospirillum oleiclasticum]
MTAPITEETVARLVDVFYERARRDPLLGPVFDQAIEDWDGHLAVIGRFWSAHLIGGPHGGGRMFMAHAQLPIEPAHFDRWLALFDQTAAELLPPDAHRKAMKTANHAASSLKAGLFTVPGVRFGKPRGDVG